MLNLARLLARIGVGTERAAQLADVVAGVPGEPLVRLSGEDRVELEWGSPSAAVIRVGFDNVEVVTPNAVLTGRPDAAAMRELLCAPRRAAA